MNGFPAAVCAAVALWCSLGTIGVVGAASPSARVALLAPWWLLPLLVAMVFAAIRVFRLSPGERSPLFGSAVLILPWLPLPVPAAALIWTGPVTLAIWVTVVVGVLLARPRNDRDRWVTNPRRAPVAAGMLALVLYGASAVWLSPILPDGDEPHYLILAQSLIKDGDLRIENNHRQGDYLDYSLNAAAPDYLRRGINGEIYSIHAPGLAVLIAPAMWLFGYPGVVAFLAVVAALSTALVWSLAYRTTGSVACAWIGWTSCALTTPFFFQATEVFPDGIAATCLLLGTIPLWEFASPAEAGHEVRETRTSQTWTCFWSGVSLAILPWLQTRLAVLAIAAAVCLLARLRGARQRLAFAAAPLIGAALWFGFFIVVYGTPNPTAPYGPYTQTSPANLLRGFPGLLFDQQFGLIPNAPVYGFVIAGVLVAAIKLRRWGWETLVLTVPYMAAVGTYQMWWGGTSVPARLLAPITLVLGVAAARVWQNIQARATKTVGILALIVSVLITIALAGPDHGRLLLNFRDGISLWLEWANDVVNLPKGLPSLFHDDRLHLWLKVAVWGATLVTLWIAVRVAGANDAQGPMSSMAAGRPRGPHYMSWQTTWCAAVAVMLGFTLAWRVDGAEPVTPGTAELTLLRHRAPLRSFAYDFGSSRFEKTNVLLSNVRIASDQQRRPVSPPTLFGVRDLPAGTYQLRATSRQPAEGTLVARVGSTSLPFVALPTALADKPSADVSFRLSTDVRSLTIDGDPAAARSVSSVKLVPVEPAAALYEADSESAHRAVGYESADAFFLDEHAYPEPTGFWIAGGRTAAVTIASRGDHLSLFLRNAPVDNRLTIDIGGDIQEFQLRAGEERLVSLQRAPDMRPLRLRITSQSGFRPSTTEPGSSDQRYLGCWVEIR